MAIPDLAQAPLQLPSSVVIISARLGEDQGAMTAGAMYVSQKPPLIAVSVSQTFATHLLIQKSREFVINVLADDQKELARQFGSVHGYEADKFEKFGIATEPAAKVKAALLSGCFSNVECVVRSALWEVAGNHSIYIAEPVAFRMNKKLKPMVWLGGAFYSVGAECRL